MSSENKIKLLEHAASIFSLLHLYRYEYRIKNLIGKGYREIGELGLAKELQTRVVDIAKKKKFIHLYLEALVDAGIIERDLGYPLKAEELFLTALEMAEKINSNNWRVEVLRNLGYLYLKLGRLDEVKSVLSKAELLKNKISNKRFLSNLLLVILKKVLNTMRKHIDWQTKRVFLNGKQQYLLIWELFIPQLY